MELHYGCIYLVNFDPCIGREYRKVRPALVVQSDVLTTVSPLVTVMPISTKIERKEVYDILLVKDDINR
ncbi:MAG: type II toxin-antitoxin system PemK/MazF family toxin [Ignavibacteriae bacterium]|nr:type II toxin-antitoxin system PemK/MazF family toxin [Ignavibacteriota bacterium]